MWLKKEHPCCVQVSFVSRVAAQVATFPSVSSAAQNEIITSLLLFVLCRRRF